MTNVIDVTNEATEVETLYLEALAKIDELEAKVKAQAVEAGQRTKKATADLKDQVAERDAKVEQLEGIVIKQEALVASQQQAIVELQEKCEAAYESHNEMVRKLDAVSLILGK